MCAKTYSVHSTHRTIYKAIDECLKLQNRSYGTLRWTIWVVTQVVTHQSSGTACSTSYERTVCAIQCAQWCTVLQSSISSQLQSLLASMARSFIVSAGGVISFEVHGCRHVVTLNSEFIGVFVRGPRRTCQNLVNNSLFNIVYYNTDNINKLI